MTPDNISRQYTLGQLRNWLSQLEQQSVLETRIEEKMRLEPQLQTLKRAYVLACQREASRLRRNAAYQDALGVWRDMLEMFPQDGAALQAVRELDGLLMAFNSAKALTARLARIREIRPVFRELKAALEQPADTAEYQLLREQVGFFLEAEPPDAEGFLLWWTECQQPGQANHAAVNVAQLAQRVQEGKILLFIGSGLGG